MTLPGRTHQKFERLYSYIHEYQRLVYDFYSKDAVAFLTTYYHINTGTTVWDDEFLYGGSYENIGDLSGIRWDKILLLPVYFIEDIATAFDAQEIGYIKEGDTTFVIPSSYGFTPLPDDIIKLETEYLNPVNDIYPIYIVTGVEKSANTQRTFWKLRVKVEQSQTTEEMDRQVANVYTFFDYDKKIHTLNDAEFMTKLLIKNERLRNLCRYYLYDCNSGYYFGNPIVPPIC
jgi:hypothetical protein